jgi:prepilin-type N-terminal cleavage/methylation domain-containing protein
VRRRGRRRQGFTLVEVAVAVALAALFVGTVYETVLNLSRNQKAGERRSRLAIEQARIMETLLRDLRSAKEIVATGDGNYEIARNVRTPGGLELVQVTWRRGEDGETVREASDGTLAHFRAADPQAATTAPGPGFRIEETGDVTFLP